METFKLKVTYGDAQIELEGKEDMVHTILRELCNNGLGVLQTPVKKDEPALCDSNSPLGKLQSETDPTPETVSSPSTDELPTLETVVLKGGPKTEIEWLLLYAFYCSNSGASLFTRDNLRSKYEETNRFTLARGKNFAVNIKSLVSNGYISAVNANDFRIELGGQLKAKEILQNTSLGKGDKTKSKNTQSKKAPASYKLLELGLSEGDRQSFKKYYNEHNHTSNIDKAVLGAYWLKKEKSIDVFSADHLFTLLRTIEEPTSFDLAASIKNAKNLKTYFIAGTESGIYSIHHIGEDHIKKLKQKDNQS